MSPVTVSSSDLKRLVDKEKGKAIIQLLSGGDTASSMLTICVTLASILPTVCHTQEDAEFTMSELTRLINDLTSQVYQARASGELKVDTNTALKWDDAKWGN